MSISPYVHRYADHARLKKTYGSKNNSDITAEYVYNILKNPSLEDIKKEMKNISGEANFSNARKFFKEFANDLTAQFSENTNYKKIEEGLIYKSSNITNSFGDSIQKKTSDIQKNIQNLDTLIKKIEEYEKTVENFIKTQDYKSILQEGVLASYSGDKLLSNYEVIRSYRAKLGNNIVVQTNNLNRSQGGKFANLMAMKEVLKKILDSLNLRVGSQSISEKEAGNIEHAIGSSLFYMGLISGDIREYITYLKAQDIPKEQIKKYFSGMNNVSIQTEGTKSVKNAMSSVSKGDVSIIIKDDEASIIAKIPMSIIGTGLQFGGKGALSIHTSSTVRSVFSSISKQQGNDLAFQGLLNMIMWSSDKRYSPEEKENYEYTVADRNEMYRRMRNSAIINALAGSLKGGDYSYFFMVNNKVFSMYELLYKVISNKDSNYISSVISTQEKQPNVSNLKTISPDNWDGYAIGKQLSNMHFDIKLKMNIFKNMS